MTGFPASDTIVGSSRNSQRWGLDRSRWLMEGLWVEGGLHNMSAMK